MPTYLYWPTIAHAAIVGANVFAFYLMLLGLYAVSWGILFHIAAFLLSGFYVFHNAPRKDKS